MSLILRANLYSSFLQQKAEFFDNPLNSNENLLSLLNNEATDTRAVCLSLKLDLNKNLGL